MAWITKKFTGSGAVNVSFSSEFESILEQVRFTLDSAASTVENFVCVLDSAAGSQYDVQLIVEPMTGVKSFIRCFDNNTKFLKDDSLAFIYTNTDSRIWGLEIKMMVLC